uniref:Ig-like domain-containing protein n=1 Tax=Astyanax mexicanus TaxID=7994 RepID=A0A3B1J3P8_ASTMX
MYIKCDCMHVDSSLFCADGPDLPQIDVTPSSGTEGGFSALEKGNISLMCQASSNPASQYYWFYNNSHIYSRPQLTIIKILRMQTGNYTCQAKNSYLNTTSTKTTTLTVYLPVSKPYVLLSDSSPVEGMSLWMRCVVEKGTGPVNYSWEQESQSGLLTTPASWNNSLVNVTSVTRNHSGWYRCLARNAVNQQRSEHTWLDVLCKWVDSYPFYSMC